MSGIKYKPTYVAQVTVLTIRYTMVMGVNGRA